MCSYPQIGEHHLYTYHDRLPPDQHEQGDVEHPDRITLQHPCKGSMKHQSICSRNAIRGWVPVMIIPCVP